MRLERAVTAALAALLMVGGSARFATAAPQAQDPPPTTASQAPQVPANLDRIREAVKRPPALQIDDGQLKIYVEVIAKWPRFDEHVKGYDLMNGPTRGGAAMTHSEFLRMVTPKEMYGSGGIGAPEMLQFALVNWLGKAIIQKGLEAIRNARSDREIQEIRERIDRELAALKRSGGSEK